MKTSIFLTLPKRAQAKVLAIASSGEDMASKSRELYKKYSKHFKDENQAYKLVTNRRQRLLKFNDSKPVESSKAPKAKLEVEKVESIPLSEVIISGVKMQFPEPRIKVDGITIEW